MKALTWHGKGDMRCESVPDPRIEHPRDVKAEDRRSCRRSIHDLLRGMLLLQARLLFRLRAVEPEPPEGGEVLGSFAGWPFRLFAPPRRICWWPGGVFARPYADIGPIKVPDSLTDEQVLFLSDIFPTGYMAADFCNIRSGDTIAIWGCGPVGQFAIRSAFLLGAERVLAIDTVPERLELARGAGAQTIDFKAEDVYDRIQELTQGRGADACIDAVGTEPSTIASFDSVVDRVKVATFMGTDRPHVLRQAIHCCRNFGTVSIVGVYGGFLDQIPMGSAINRGLTFKMAQTPVQHYLPSLLQQIEKGEIDPSFVITHRASLEEGPDLYKTFRDKKDGCIKVVLKP